MTVFLRSPGAFRPTSRANTLPSLLLRHSLPARDFHATPAAKSWIEPVLQTTHTLIETVHSTTGLPWVLTLPLTALTVRLCFALPLQLYSRNNTQKQWSILPLVSGWSQQIRAFQMKEKRHLGPAVVEKEIAKAVRAKRKQLYKRWGCSHWKGWLTTANLFVWLPVMETVRRMVGARSGILGYVTGETSGDVRQGAGSSSATSAGTDTITEGGVSLLPAAAQIGDSSSMVVKDLVWASYFEPTMATEGALWFSDLTAADPLLLLPFVLSATMLLNLMPSQRAANNVPGVVIPPWRRRLTNVLRAIALAAGPLTLHLPTGMLVYWISSMSFGFLQNLVLERFMPLKRPIMPCKVESQRKARGGT